MSTVSFERCGEIFNNGIVSAVNTRDAANPSSRKSGSRFKRLLDSFSIIRKHYLSLSLPLSFSLSLSLPFSLSLEREGERKREGESD